MKIRTGFISNSSSSSFILAVREDITENEKAEIFENFIRGYWEELCNDDYADNKIMSEHEIMNSIFNVKSKNYGVLKLDNWYVEGGEASSEGGDFKSMLFYSLPAIDTKKFKFKTTC